MESLVIYSTVGPAAGLCLLTLVSFLLPLVFCFLSEALEGGS